MDIDVFDERLPAGTSECRWVGVLGLVDGAHQAICGGPRIFAVDARSSVESGGRKRSSNERCGATVRVMLPRSRPARLQAKRSACSKHPVRRPDRHRDTGRPGRRYPGHQLAFVHAGTDPDSTAGQGFHVCFGHSAILGKLGDLASWVTWATWATSGNLATWQPGNLATKSAEMRSRVSSRRSHCSCENSSSAEYIRAFCPAT